VPLSLPCYDELERLLLEPFGAKVAGIIAFPFLFCNANFLPLSVASGSAILAGSSMPAKAASGLRV
jgi:hypothetical protein